MAMAVIRLVRPAISPAAAAAASSSPSSVRPRGRVVRMRVRCRAGGSEGGLGEEEEGEEAPESLFAKELRRRGMAPGSAVPGVKKAGTVEAEEGGRGGEAGRKRVAAAEFERVAAGAEGQRERSMALNSEGLEGLVPRAKLLLSLGSTFFLGFGPLIIVTVSLFAGLYVVSCLITFSHSHNRMCFPPVKTL
ncbi:hypothetical protein ABZP36_009303 [Zizania latifolia]